MKEKKSTIKFLPVPDEEPEKIKLDLGAGFRKQEGFTSVDNDPTSKPDVCWDLNKTPYPFKDSSVDYIYSAQVLEHLSLHSIEFFKECHRILKPNGKLEFWLPNMWNWKYRILFLFGKGTESLEWHPYHTKMLSPEYLMELLRHIGFSPKIDSLYQLRGSIHIIARKRN
jgi:predicted SAM-dependent methyltransferase